MLGNECIVATPHEKVSPNGNLMENPSVREEGTRIISETQQESGSSQVSGSTPVNNTVCHSVNETGTPDVKAQYKSKYYACPSSGPLKYIHRTPPSRNKSIVVTNPFDVGITDRLHLPMYSPSVFARVVSPSQDSPTFRWTIEDIARIYPADIEEFPTHQYDVDVDPELESKAQEAINRFFCKSQQLLPSPWNPKPDSISNRQEQNATTPSSAHVSLAVSSVHPTNQVTDSDSDLDQSGSSSKVTSREVWTQTTLTLPPILPPSMELALKPFFTFTQDQRQAQQADSDDGVLSTSSLRRKLFFQSDSPPLAAPSTPNLPNSVHGPSAQSLLHFQGRSFGTPLPGANSLQSPSGISPVHSGISPVHNSVTPMRRVKSATRLDFSREQEEMAIDTSLTNLPNTPSRQATLQGSCSPLGTAPLHDKDSPEDHSEHLQSSAKWVKRNKRNSLDCSSDSMRLSQPSTPLKSNISMDLSVAPNMMDISHSKPLSHTDRWQDGDQMSDVTFHHDVTGFSYSQQAVSSNILLQDTGYGTRSSCDPGAFHSGTNSTFGLSLTRDKMGYEDSLGTWPVNPNLISSTPTKTSG